MPLPKLTPEMVEEAVNRIVEAVHPLQIIAFGSRARGEARPDSDLDLLVVTLEANDAQTRFDISVKLHELLRDIRFAKDILVSDNSHLAVQESYYDSVYKEAAHFGLPVWLRGKKNSEMIHYVAQ
jgi:predicted nucleotidyltransferase